MSTLLTAIAAAGILVALWTAFLVRVEHVPLMPALRTSAVTFGVPAILAGLVVAVLRSGPTSLLAGIAVVVFVLLGACAALLRRLRSRRAGR